MLSSNTRNQHTVDTQSTSQDYLQVPTLQHFNSSQQSSADTFLLRCCFRCLAFGIAHASLRSRSISLVVVPGRPQSGSVHITDPAELM